MIRYSAIWLVVAALLLPSVSHAQEHPASDRPSVSPILTVLASILIPKMIADCYQLRAYIRTEEFQQYRRSYGDLCAVDEIYDRALRLSWNNVGVALFVSTFATMDHRRVGVHVPVVGPLLWFPLTSEFEDDFQRRVNALPSRLYPDTPPGHAGDRDKLQHFFGSAFLGYVLESDDAAARVGDFIEWGEDLFIVGGVNDARDQRSNRQGRAFGLRLLDDRTALPSDELFPCPLTPAPAVVCAFAADSAFPVLEER